MLSCLVSDGMYQLQILRSLISLPPLPFPVAGGRCRTLFPTLPLLAGYSQVVLSQTLLMMLTWALSSALPSTLPSALPSTLPSALPSTLSLALSLALPLAALLGDGLFAGLPQQRNNHLRYVLAAVYHLAWILSAPFFLPILRVAADSRGTDFPPPSSSSTLSRAHMVQSDCYLFLLSRTVVITSYEKLCFVGMFYMKTKVFAILISLQVLFYLNSRI